MYLSFLYLKDFRNYSSLELRIKDGVSLFYGANAAGKTNFLEACCYLSSLGSPRAERESDLARWGTTSFEIAGRVEHAGEEALLKVETSVAPVLRRKVTINDAPAKKRDLSSTFPSVYFSPDDLYIVKKGSSLRRRYLDSILSCIDPTYGAELGRYHDAVERRNTILKRLKWDKSWQRALEGLDEVVVETGSSLLSKRIAAMGKLSPLVAGTYEFISGETCSISYVSSLKSAPPGELPEDRASIATLFRKAMKAVESEERERCVTLVGPHRDDISVERGGATMRYFGSQGEQRSAALALKIAEAKIIEEAFGKKPVLLLDDVFSELDQSRRYKILSLCDFGHQILITSTDLVPMDKREFSAFHVKDDAIQ